MPCERTIAATALTSGQAQGRLLWTDTPLSFWGGVDPASGCVIDRQHPLCGASLAGRVLCLPQGRGSCTGSGVLLELILNGHAPAAIVFCEDEEILALGALVGELMFACCPPVLRVTRDDFQGLAKDSYARVEAGGLHVFPAAPEDDRRPAPSAATVTLGGAVDLDPKDRAMLDGRDGPAVQMAMQLLVRMAALQGATRFLDVTQVHIDGCIYTGPASLRFAEFMAAQGGRVRVPTTLNAISIDQHRWRALGVAETLGMPAAALADAYVSMGARPSFTCAPYLLDSAPAFGEQVGWAESNAVVYANSVLGARTAKYPDFLDLCIALTGRAPLAGCHTDEGRRATVAIAVDWPEDADDAVWPLLGYACGFATAGAIPLVEGLEHCQASQDDLKAFGAAFATTSSAPMFHIAGVTLEAASQAPGRRLRLGRDELRHAWDALNTAGDAEVDLVCLGNPHFSLTEFAALARLVNGRQRSPTVAVIVTCGRAVHAAATRSGHITAIEAFGATIVMDTCWCMLGEPVVPPGARTLMTNSGKYAHYAPGLVGSAVRFGSLADCVEAACTGRSPRQQPAWLATPA